MAKIERKIKATCLKDTDGNRIYLDELNPKSGNFKKEEPISCGIDFHLVMDKFEKI